MRYLDQNSQNLQPFIDFLRSKYTAIYSIFAVKFVYIYSIFADTFTVI